MVETFFTSFKIQYFEREWIQKGDEADCPFDSLMGIMSVHNKDYFALVVNRRFLVFFRWFSAEIDDFRLG